MRNRYRQWKARGGICHAQARRDAAGIHLVCLRAEAIRISTMWVSTGYGDQFMDYLAGRPEASFLAEGGLNDGYSPIAANIIGF